MSAVTRSFAIAPLAFIAVFGASRIGLPISGCIVQHLLGIRCPGCGITRSVAALLHGDLTDALAANAAGPLVCVSFVFYAAIFVLAVSRMQREEVLLRWTLRNDRLLMIGLITAWFWHGGNEWLR